MEYEWEEAFAEISPGKIVEFNNIIPMDTLTFPGINGKAAVKLNFANDPPTVWINPDLAWDVAAKQFWNAVYRCVGRPALFRESDM